MRDFFLQSGPFDIMAVGCVFFASIYVIFGAITAFLARYLLPKMAHGGRLDPRPVASGQVRRELGLSACSILIFGLGLIFPWGLLRLGWADLALAPSVLQIATEIMVLITWNEVHFYLNHRLLHSPWLRRFHLPHHRSVVVTPWATYAFHPVEALLLGNVILAPMLVHDFSSQALIALPLFSLLFNCIGHSNYDFLPDAHADRWWLNGARRHHIHHVCYGGNFGFMFPFLDRVWGTALDSSAAQPVLAKALAAGRHLHSQTPTYPPENS